MNETRDAVRFCFSLGMGKHEGRGHVREQAVPKKHLEVVFLHIEKVDTSAVEGCRETRCLNTEKSARIHGTMFRLGVQSCSNIGLTLVYLRLESPLALLVLEEKIPYRFGLTP